MDDGVLHRLSIICKDFYTLNSIDNLFIFAGAKSEWLVFEPKSTPNTSQRITRCYGWFEGLRIYAPQLENQILTSVITDVCQNTAIPEALRTALHDGLSSMTNKTPKIELELEQLLATLVRALASSGLAREVAVVTYATPQLIWNNNDNFEGVDCYKLVLAVPYKLYDQIHDDVDRIDQVIQNHVWPIQQIIQGEKITMISVVPQLVKDDKWRDKAIAWLSGQNVNNQGRVRSDNVAPLSADGLVFRSQPEIFFYKAMKAQGVSFAPLPVFVRGGQSYQRIEPDFVVINNGIMMVIEVDGDTYHRETPAEAQNRTTMLELEGARIVHIQAADCDTQEKADRFAKSIITRINKLKEAGR